MTRQMSGPSVLIRGVLRYGEGDPVEVRANPVVVEAYLGKQG